MCLVDDLDFNRLQEVVGEKVREVVDLRSALPAWTEQDMPDEMHRHLLHTRAVQDRIEEIVGWLTVARGRVRTALREAKEKLQDAVSAAATDARVRVKMSEYDSKLEREAVYHTRTTAERMAVSRLERYEELLSQAVDRAYLAHRGVEGLRRDIDLRMRLVALDTRLERG